MATYCGQRIPDILDEFPGAEFYRNPFMGRHFGQVYAFHKVVEGGLVDNMAFPKERVGPDSPYAFTQHAATVWA